jgi:DNA-binding transcriptional ArsR family regulator
MPNINQQFLLHSELFKALAHPTRLAILSILREGEQCVCHLEATLKLRQANISQHLMILREAGLVADRRDGWNIYYHLTNPEVCTLLDAAYRLKGMPQPIAHVHAAGDCPCPICEQHNKCS